MAVYGGSEAPRPQGRIRYDAIGEAFNMVKENAGTWILIMLVYLAVLIGINMVVGVILGATGISPKPMPGQQPNWAAFAVAQMISMVISLTLSAFLTGGLYRAAIKQVRREAVTIGDLFSAGDVVGALVVAALLTALAVNIGSIFCLIPGLLLAGLLMLTNPIIVDQKAGGIDAMKASINALKGDMWNALGFLFVAGIVAALGMLACGVGILFTAPVAYVAQAIVYNDFFGSQEGRSFAPDIQMPLPPPTGNYPG